MLRSVRKPTNRRPSSPLVAMTVCLLVLATAGLQANIDNQASVEPPTPVVLNPSIEQKRVTANILDRLVQGYYERRPINDGLSERLFDSYLADLDPTKSYFYIQDIEEFEQFRLKLDDALKKGNLKPAYFIYNRYQLRLTERLNYAVNLLKNNQGKFDYEKDQHLDLDREDAQWLDNPAAMDDLWYKRVKSNALNLKLAGKEPADILETLLKRYKNQLNLANQTTAEDAYQTYINAFTHTYDPHTQYFSPRSSENFNINMRLSLEGIGAVLQTDEEYTKVLRLVPGGPADKAGDLQPSDRIIGVGQGVEGKIETVIGWRLDKVVDQIRGNKGSTVRLELIPASAKHGETKVINIVRDRVKLEDQSAQKDVIQITRGDGQNYRIGVIDIPTFYIDFEAMQARKHNYKSTSRDVRRLLKELKEEQIDGLVIDLRNNGGGSLQEANAVTGLFIGTGPTVQVKSASGRIDVLSDMDPSVVYDGPLVVLVNRLSASASEIFAGAIQDFQRGIIVGGKTFGKGTVQSLHTLDRGQLKMTQAKFYRISGGSTQNEGVHPDIAFPEIYNHETIGESTLPEALAWDSIRSTRYNTYYSIIPLLDELRLRHSSRTQDNPDFNYLKKQIQIRDELGKRTKISLRESTRKQERETNEKRQLDLENARLAAKGYQPVKDLEELEKKNREIEKYKKETTEYAMLLESGQILVDFIEVSQQPAYAARPNVLKPE